MEPEVVIVPDVMESERRLDRGVHAHRVESVVDALLGEGEVAHEMFVVVSGELEVRRGDEMVATIGAGGFAGEMALLTRARRDASVVAKTDVSVLHLDGRSFGSVLDEAPQIAVKMLPVVAARVVANSTHHEH